MIWDRNSPISPDEWATRGMNARERADYYDAVEARRAEEVAAEEETQRAMEEDTFQDASASQLKQNNTKAK